jgi:hypothetical protein
MGFRGQTAEPKKTQTGSTGLNVPPAAGEKSQTDSIQMRSRLGHHADFSAERTDPGDRPLIRLKARLKAACEP